MFDLSDDDDFSTQLEGKKLKNRGASLKDKIGNSGDGLNMEQEAPLVGENDVDVEIKIDPDYISNPDLIAETEEEREERLQKEMNAARLQQQEQLKQQQEQDAVKNPGLQLNKIEQGIMLSQNEGRPVDVHEFRQNGPDRSEKEQLAEDHQDKSVAAKMLPDIRGKSGEINR